MKENNSYLVFARKHRPQGFDELIGQEHITELLKKAIENNRVGQAFLFCGPRGVGKTSCARILAKCLNAEGGPTVNPDEKNFMSQEITKGTSLDVIEIDGASNRGIDEVRVLRENVKFSPSYGRYKIYIVDEVHMLTTEAFNALLKTLEEPPEHVKFIFATTEPNKVPSTILSRCQRYDFKRIPTKTVVSVLEGICKKEKIKVSPDALFAIAKAAQGSLRDALGVLDQLSVIKDKELAADDVFGMLGLVETQYLFEIVDHIAQKNCAGALSLLEKVLDLGKDLKQLSKDLTEHFRNLMVIKIGGKTLGKLVDYPATVKDMLLEQSEKFTLADIIRAIDMLIKAQETARITESFRMPLEIVLAKLTYQGEAVTKVPPTVKSVIENVSSKIPIPDRLKDKRGEIPIVNVEQKHIQPKAIDPVDVQEDIIEEKLDERPADLPSGDQSFNLERLRKDWDKLTHLVSRKRMSLATYLQDGAPVQLNGNQIIIGFPRSSSFSKESLEGEVNVRFIETTFSEQLGVDVRVKYAFVEKIDKPSDMDNNVKDVMETFGGEITKQWHNE